MTWTPPLTLIDGDIFDEDAYQILVDDLNTIYNGVPVGLATPSMDQTTGITPTANQGIFIPCVSSAYGSLASLSVFAATTAGNIDVGVYAADGTKIRTLGSTALSGGSGLKTYTFASPATIEPFTKYYLAYACSSASASLKGTQGPSVVVAKTMSSAFPLPSTATFGAAPSAYAALYGPLT